MHIAIRGAILAPILCTAGAQAADLTIRIDNVENNDGMHTNRLGRPTEAVAFSKDAQGFMGPPSFAAARFTVPADGAAVTASLR